MAKTTVEQWAKARAMFEADKSLRDIGTELNIPFTTISNRSKKEGWKRGVLVQVISDTVRVREQFGTLETVQQQVVQKEVDERMKHIEFFNRAALKNVSVSVKKINEETSQMEHKLIAETILKGKEAVLGKTPDTVINNTNAQQNNVSVRAVSTEERERLRKAMDALC